MNKLNCRGIGVIIDDKVPLAEGDSTEDAISEIVNQLKSDGISLLKYREIPPENEWDNFGNVAFLLVDWSLLPSNAGDTAKRKMEDKICDFIKKIHVKAFAPIFVFSNQNDDEIKIFLKNTGIEIDTQGAYVLVRTKSEMMEFDEAGSPKLFEEINNWILTTPTIHLLTTWGNDVLMARNQMFAEFYDKNHYWPSLLWKAYEDDKDDPAYGLSQVMFDNLKARVRCNLDKIPASSPQEDTLTALTDVLALTVMLPSRVLHQKQIGCGDLYEIGNSKYLLVVSCDCDCIKRTKQQNTNATNIQVLEVSEPIARKDKKIFDRINPKRGYIHKITESYIFPIDGQCYKIDYRTLQLIPREKIESMNRKGRILPPYITDIRLRLAQWNQRVGFPKLPPELFTPA